MARNTHTPSAISKRSWQLKGRSALALKLSVLLPVLVLAGCQTTRSGIPTAGTVRILDVQCWPKKITYSKADTSPTKSQVREHNATGRNIGCW